MLLGPQGQPGGDTWGPGCTEQAAEHLARWRRCCEHAPYNVGHLTLLVTSPSNIFPDNFSAIASCSRTNGVYYFLAVSASPALYPDALGGVFAASFFTYQCSSSAASLHFFALLPAALVLKPGVIALITDERHRPGSAPPSPSSRRDPGPNTFQPALCPRARSALPSHGCQAPSPASCFLALLCLIPGRFVGVGAQWDGGDGADGLIPKPCSGVGC